MEFNNIFDKGQTPPAEPAKGKDFLDLEKEIDRLKRCQTNLNQYAGTTKANTLKALKSGTPLEEIFLDLCKGVALMTAEPLFYETVKNYMNTTK